MKVPPVLRQAGRVGRLRRLGDHEARRRRKDLQRRRGDQAVEHRLGASAPRNPSPRRSASPLRPTPSSSGSSPTAPVTTSAARSTSRSSSAISAGCKLTVSTRACVTPCAGTSSIEAGSRPSEPAITAGGSRRITPKGKGILFDVLATATGRGSPSAPSGP